MKVGSSEYQTLLNIVKKNPKITSSEAIHQLHDELRADNSVVEILSLQTIASRYLNNLGFFGGI